MRHIYRDMPSLIKRVMHRMQRKQFVHFLHIGKTGGSAIKYALRQYPVGSRYVIRLHPHNVSLCDIPKGNSVIFSVREPISRFVSGFYSRKRQGQPRTFSPWSQDERKAFEYFSTPNQLAVAISSKNTEEKEIAHRAMTCIDHIRSSYWDWFKSEEYFRSRLLDILFICFQE